MIQESRPRLPGGMRAGERGYTFEITSAVWAALQAGENK